MNLTSAIVAAGTGATQLRAAQWVAAIQAACDRYEISTPLRASAFLAQIGHESMGLSCTREIWGPTPAQTKYEGRADLGNTEQGDGKRFMGRGLIQITGRRNYTLAAVALDLDLLNHPELLEQPANAASSAAWYWFNRYLSGYADVGQFDRITRIINGGTNGAAERLALYGAAKKALGI